jgi:hypothetical protein
MNKFSVNNSDLQSQLSQKKVYRLADVKHRIRKVAFDVVRFTDSNKIDDLWQIHRDGEDEYIVAMYDEEVTKTAAFRENWSCVADSSSSFINVFYKGAPVTKLSLASLDIPTSDSALVCEYLPRQLASNEAFRTSFINGLSETDRKMLEEQLLLAGK